MAKTPILPHNSIMAESGKNHRLFRQLDDEKEEKEFLDEGNLQENEDDAPENSDDDEGDSLPTNPFLSFVEFR